MLVVMLNAEAVFNLEFVMICKKMSDYQSETGNTSADHYSIVKSDFYVKRRSNFLKIYNIF